MTQAGPTGAEREAQRQAQLLRALQGLDARDALMHWVVPRSVPRLEPQVEPQVEPRAVPTSQGGSQGSLRGRFERGFEAYRANAGALAERALGAAYPTVAALVGEESFGLLARAFWHRHAPERGDLAWWGEALAAFIAADPQLADVPYLADVARVDWAVHRAESAADDDGAAPAGLALLAHTEPDALRLTLRAGTALVRSPFPVVALWAAHRLPADTPQRAQAFAGLPQALAAGCAEAALVQRVGWRATVQAVAAPEAAFSAALLAQETLEAALAAAGDAFDFEAWLLGALQRRAIASITLKD